MCILEVDRSIFGWVIKVPKSTRNFDPVKMVQANEAKRIWFQLMEIFPDEFDQSKSEQFWKFPCQLRFPILEDRALIREATVRDLIFEVDLITM